MNKNANRDTAALTSWTWKQRLTATPRQNRDHLLARVVYATEVAAAMPLDIDPHVRVSAIDHQATVQATWDDVVAAGKLAARFGLDQHAERGDEETGDVYHSWFAGEQIDSPLTLVTVVES